jgi:hypothetical protein
MRSIRLHIMLAGVMAWLCLPNPVRGQSFVHQIHITAGGGVNSSFFDIGAGSPGLSLWATSQYMWDEHWKAGFHFGYHEVKGTDEGTANFGRGLAYESEIYEFSVRGEYLIFFSFRGGAKWKLSQNSYLYYRGVWQRRFKPFVFAGAGALHYTPFLYSYFDGRPLDENQNIPYWAPIMNAGFGIYFFITPYWTVGLEIGSNFPFFDYTRDYPDYGFSNKVDMWHQIGIKITRNQNVGTVKRHGDQKRRR